MITKRLTLTLFLIAAFAPTLAFAQGNFEQLYKNKQFFDLRDAVEKAAKPLPPDYLFYRAAVANRFNDPKGSISFLDTFLKLRIGSDERIQEAYELLADNYVKTFQYGKAAAAYKFLEQKYKTPISEDPEAAYANLAGLWSALEGTAAQTVSVEKDTVIQGKRDKARLLNIPVELSGHKMDFVFDTGANLSTMTVSTAGKLGLKVIEADVTIGSSTANKVKSKLAVVREMRIGGIVARNVVFLVLEDEALYFPQADYRISAIVGFPVMQGIGKLTLSRDDRVTVAARRERSSLEPNMLLEGLEPVIAAEHNGKRMAFSFDTGATRTTFYNMFYEAASKAERAAAEPKTIKSGGAGGMTETPGYKMKDVEMSVGGKIARFPEIEVISEKTSERSRYFYGNIGQDVIKQHEKMTLDFISMRITFE
jgi:predicted aspartyl protease